MERQERQIQHGAIFDPHTLNLGVPMVKPQEVKVDERLFKAAMKDIFKEEKK